ncbi:MAG TPA: DUF4878 domain-containing protein [Flavobacteriales bacterium]|nr:DUF4878 domain-containing protein [Flavobacteriales bacterium]
MKTPFLLALATTVILAACGGGGDMTPSQVAEKYLAHLNKMEFKEAKAYGTEKTAGMLDLLSGMAAMMPKTDNVSSKITGETIDGDKATVTYRTDGKDADETLTLIKQDGKWLVDMAKEEGMGDTGGDMMNDLDAGMDSLMDGAGEAMQEAGEVLEEAAQ